jgi:hypothetical protein
VTRVNEFVQASEPEYAFVTLISTWLMTTRTTARAIAAHGGMIPATEQDRVVRQVL